MFIVLIFAIYQQLKFKKMTKLEALHEALQLIKDAQQLVQDVLEGTEHEAHFNAYGKYGFDQLLGNGNRFDSSVAGLLDEFGDEELY